MQLCPQGAAAWWGNPRLPSRACKFSSTLTAKAYSAAGQAASALHVMALLHVHQAKALKQLHEGGADPGVLQELRTATDPTLRTTKVTAHSDPTLGRTAFRVGSLCFTSLPHCGYIGGSLSPACSVSGSLASAPQTVSLAHKDHQTRLCDSVHPAPSQVQGHSVHLCAEQRCSYLSCRDHGPAGEGRDTAGHSSRDEVRVLQPLLHRRHERQWVTTNLGPTLSEPGPSQAPVQDVDAETHLSMHPSFRLVRSDRPEGRVL